MIIFSKSNSLTSQLNLNCSAGSIKIATKVKYLGVIIDDKLNYKDHINFVETKISGSVGILGKLKYYLDHTSLLKLDYALIHSHINHGLIIWGNNLSVISDKINDSNRIRQLEL